MDNLFNDLKFVRVKQPAIVRLIPSELIENVKGRSFTVHQFYEYQEAQISMGNFNNLLYVIVDIDNIIHGYLWAVLEWENTTLFVNTFSISKEFWHKGKAMPIVKEFLKSLNEKIKAEKIIWATTNEKFFKKHGFKRSKVVLMEYSE